MRSQQGDLKIAMFGRARGRNRNPLRGPRADRESLRPGGRKLADASERPSGAETPAMPRRPRATRWPQRPGFIPQQPLQQLWDGLPPAVLQHPLAHEALHAPLVEAARDDDALDLGGALPDPLHAQLAEEALGDVLAHVAAAPEDLHGAVGDAARHLRGVELRHRGLRVHAPEVLLAAGLVHRARGRVGDEARRPELRQRVGEHLLDQLVLPDRLAELDAALRELAGLRDEAPGRAEAARRDHRALVQEPLLGDREPLSDAAEAVLVGAAHPPEGQLRAAVDQVVGVAGMLEHLDPRRIEVDEEEGVALADAGIGGALHHRVVADVARGHMPLLPVDPPPLAIAHGGGGHAARVRARARLGDGVAGRAVALRRGAYPALDLRRRGAAQHDRRREDDPAEAVRDRADLLVDHDLGFPGVAGAADRAREARGGDAERLGLGLELGAPLRVEATVRELDLDLEGLELPDDEVADHLAQVLELGGEGEVHGGVLLEGVRRAQGAKRALAFGTTSASTTTARSGSATSGFTSTASTRSPRSSARAERPSAARTIAPSSAGGRPRAPRRSRAPRSLERAARTSCALAGRQSQRTSARISTWIPPIPTVSIGPKCGSATIPSRSSTPGGTCSCTSTRRPSRDARSR